MKYLLLIGLLASATAVNAADPFVKGDAKAGEAKAAVCSACHGPGGNSGNPEWPKLAGQSSIYVAAQLQNFKLGYRKNPLMSGQAANLSDQDMKDLAAYFAAQPATPGVASPDAVKKAEKLYRAGDAARGLPACGACHGPSGAGNPAAGYPRLGGQHATYTISALRQMQAEDVTKLPDSPIKVMGAIADKLTEAEMADLASYVNGLQ